MSFDTGLPNCFATLVTGKTRFQNFILVLGSLPKLMDLPVNLYQKFLGLIACYNSIVHDRFIF